jgi:hypothetical protein
MEATLATALVLGFIILPINGLLFIGIRRERIRSARMIRAWNRRRF